MRVSEAEIVAHAKRVASMTDEELAKAVKHDSSCVCAVCEKFAVYYRVKQTILEWEKSKPSALPGGPVSGCRK